jgi:hypothetical protein
MIKPAYLLNGILVGVAIVCLFSLSNAALIPQVPDTQQPITGSLGNPVMNACAPVSVVNVTEYWDNVINHPGANMVNAGLIPPTAADYISYFVDHGNWGSPVRLNGTVYPASVGTYAADIQPGFFEFVRWDAVHPYTTPPPALPIGKLGYDWTYLGDFAQGFDFHALSIDSQHPDVICFRYWNPINSGVSILDPSGETIYFYTWGPQVPQSSPPNPVENWNLNYGQECVGHAVTGVGYFRNYDPDGPGPLPLTNWFICHDNWPGTMGNVALPWANWAATIVGNPQPVPVILVSPDSIYHSLEINNSVTYNDDFSISNTGGSNLTYTATNTLAWVSLSGISGNIPAGGTDNIDITVSTIAVPVGRYIDSVTITSNDPAHPILYKPKIVIDVIPPEIDTCDFYKSRYVDYCPNGMPDFDQKQGNWWNPQSGNFSWCGPVALANCLWWFDSKFEPNPIDPRPFYPNMLTPPPNDNFPLVMFYGPWDDHDTNNVIPFISQLGPICAVDGPTPGTMLPNLEIGFHTWLGIVGLPDAFTSNISFGPSYMEIRDSILSSQDVILLLGFYEILPTQDCQWLGGHYVTCAGVCTQEPSICISDPFFDSNEGEPPPGTAHGSTVHNDAYFVSGPHGSIDHDRFNMMPVPQPCPQSPASWMLTDYPNRWTQDGIFTFAGENPVAPIPAGVYQGGQIIVLVDAALIICPAPHHVPDINVVPDTVTHAQLTNTVVGYPNDFTISNIGTGPLNYAVTNTLPWITFGGVTGLIAPGGADNITLNVNTTGILPGLYIDSASVTSNDPDTPLINRPIIRIRVTQNQVPDIRITPDSLYHEQDSGTTVSYLSDFTIANIGLAQLTYSIGNTRAWITFAGATGSIAPGGSDAIDINVNTSGITAGIYFDLVTITSNDPDSPILNKPRIVIKVIIPEEGCDVVPGDANGNGAFNGIDVSYSVNFLKGIGPAPVDTCNCPPWGNILAAADANGSCAFNGIDVSYSVNYLKGLGPAPVLCPDCPSIIATGNKQINKQIAR